MVNSKATDGLLAPGLAERASLGRVAPKPYTISSTRLSLSLVANVGVRTWNGTTKPEMLD